MSRVSTVFQISIYGMVAAASLMLAKAEGSPFPQLLVPPAAVIAYMLVERSRAFELPVLAANTLGLIAFLAAGWEFFGENIEGRILSGAHLLSYLAIIVLFQRKDSLQYWWMCALSVLMVAVGSVLTNDETYGAMLVGFMVYSIWTLSVYSLHQAQQQYGASGGASGENATPGSLPGQTERGRFAGGTAQRHAAWSSRHSAARGSIRHDPNESWFSSQFLLTNIGTSFGAMVISAFFFLFIPRLWAGRTEWESARAELRPRAMSGFTPQVRLGDFGEVLSSAQKVLEVEIFDNDTGRKLDVEAYAASVGLAEPLFRGTVMTEYSKGTWSSVDRRSMSFRELGTDPSGGMARQEIHMEPIGTELLFGIPPALAGRIASGTDEVEVQSVHQVLYRPSRFPADKPIAYRIYSPMQPTPVKVRNEVAWRTFYGKAPGPDLARLTALAREISGYQPGKSNVPPRERANRIHAHLRNSGIYSYSLDSSIDDFAIDPVEDFLFNRKKGHCEYFATSLALMLRAVDIPARLVSGFKGGKTNAISGRFEVEQRHAHAWVEAMIDGEVAVLDATPEAREESVESFAPSLQTAHDLASFMKGTWSRYVVNMDINQQNSNFYDPLREWFRNWWHSESGVKTKLITWGESIAAFARDPRRWFSFQGAGITFAILLIGAGLYKLARRYPFFWSLMRKLFRRNGNSHRVRVPFYERFEYLCSVIGLARGSSQTQREFAEMAAQKFLALPSNGQLGEVPARIVREFYRVRFGTEDLADDEAARLVQDLASLEAAIISAKSRR